MDVAHLGPTGPECLARRPMLAFHQPGIRRKLLHAVEARDVVNLIEDRQRKHLADAGHGPEAVERIAVMALRLAHDCQLEIRDEIVVALKQREVHINALANTGIGELLADAGAIGRIGQAASKLGQLVLGSRVLNVC